MARPGRREPGGDGPEHLWKEQHAEAITSRAPTTCSSTGSSASRSTSATSRQRVEQAAVKLDFVAPGPRRPRSSHDLLELAVNGEIREPAPPSASTSTRTGTSWSAPPTSSLVHWIRRLVFRGAWLDQRVKEGELDIVFDEDTQTFGYIQPDRDSELIELSAEPSWGSISYGGRDSLI